MSDGLNTCPICQDRYISGTQTRCTSCAQQHYNDHHEPETAPTAPTATEVVELPQVPGAPDLPQLILEAFTYEQAWSFFIGTLSPAQQRGKGLTPAHLQWLLRQMLRFAQHKSPDMLPQLRELGLALDIDTSTPPAAAAAAII